MLFFSSAREGRFAVNHQAILDWQLCQFQTTNQLEKMKNSQESPKVANEVRKRAMEGEVKCTEMEIWKQARKAETVASRKWTRLNKWDRQSVEAWQHCLNLEGKNSIALQLSSEGIRVAKRVPSEESMFTTKLLGTGVIKWRTAYRVLLMFYTILKALGFQVTIWAQRRDSCYCTNLAPSKPFDAFRSLFAQHAGRDSLLC